MTTQDQDTVSTSGREIPNWVERLVDATENRFRVPFTPYRFGYDAILGLVPGLGDALGMVIGFAVVFAAHQVDASKRVIARMLGNLALDALLGTIPVVGDVFDLFFKANARNLQLLHDELDRGAASV